MCLTDTSQLAAELPETHERLLVVAGASDPHSFASGALRYEDISLVLRYTRRWIHYGMIAHIAICTLVAAIEGVLFRLFRFA